MKYFIILLVTLNLFSQEELKRENISKVWWLQESLIGNVSSIKIAETKYFFNLSAFALHDFLKRHTDWEVKYRASYDQNGNRIPTVVGDVIINNSNHVINTMTQGYYYLENGKKERLILGVLGTWRFSSEIQVIGKSNELKLLIPIVEELKTYKDKRNMFMSSVFDIVKKPNTWEGFYFKFLTNVDKYNYSWDDLILDSNLAKLTKRYSRDFIKQMISDDTKPMKKGILLYGPPGTGKSFLGQLLISDVLHGEFKGKSSFITVSARHLFSKQNIKRIYDAARTLAPTTVFIEDVDLLGVSDRDEKNSDLLNELLNELDGLKPLEKVLTVATTNKEKELDAALLRSGRLGTHLYYGHPSLELRQQFFERFVNRKNKAELGKDVEMNYLLSKSEGYSGADIVELISVAKRHALLSGSKKNGKLILRKTHFEKSFLVVKPSSPQSFEAMLNIAF